MNVVKKWVAGFWSDDLIVVKARFNETPKQFALVREDSASYRQAQIALGFTSRVIKENQDRLHDTWEEAVDALHSRVLKVLQTHRRHIEKCQEQMGVLDDFTDAAKESGLTN